MEVDLAEALVQGLDARHEAGDQCGASTRSRLGGDRHRIVLCARNVVAGVQGEDLAALRLVHHRGHASRETDPAAGAERDLRQGRRERRVDGRATFVEDVEAGVDRLGETGREDEARLDFDALAGDAIRGGGRDREQGQQGGCREAHHRCIVRRDLALGRTGG